MHATWGQDGCPRPNAMGFKFIANLTIKSILVVLQGQYIADWQYNTHSKQNP
jgi:hypothetical protein